MKVTSEITPPKQNALSVISTTIPDLGSEESSKSIQMDTSPLSWSFVENYVKEKYAAKIEQTVNEYMCSDKGDPLLKIYVKTMLNSIINRESRPNIKQVPMIYESIKKPLKKTAEANHRIPVNILRTEPIKVTRQTNSQDFDTPPSIPSSKPKFGQIKRTLSFLEENNVSPKKKDGLSFLSSMDELDQEVYRKTNPDQALTLYYASKMLENDWSLLSRVFSNLSEIKLKSAVAGCIDDALESKLSFNRKSAAFKSARLHIATYYSNDRESGSCPAPPFLYKNKSSSICGLILPHHTPLGLKELRDSSSYLKLLNRGLGVGACHKREQYIDSPQDLDDFVVRKLKF